eukprot:933267-Rhodomonas_salina.3
MTVGMSSPPRGSTPTVEIIPPPQPRSTDNVSTQPPMPTFFRADLIFGSDSNSASDYPPQLRNRRSGDVSAGAVGQSESDTVFVGPGPSVPAGQRPPHDDEAIDLANLILEPGQGSFPGPGNRHEIGEC